MGDGCGQENGRRHHGTDRMSGQNSLDDLIGSLIVFHARMPVNGNRQQTAQRQQEDQPHMFTADVRHEMQYMMEYSAQQTADHAHNHTQYAPAHHDFGIVLGPLKIFQTNHKGSLLSFRNKIILTDSLRFGKGNTLRKIGGCSLLKR